jgi:hypothetical protein
MRNATTTTTTGQPAEPHRAATAALRRGLPGRDEGMATAEYAIATLAACGFAGLLVAILRGDEVRGLLTGIVERALSLA